MKEIDEFKIYQMSYNSLIGQATIIVTNKLLRHDFHTEYFIFLENGQAIFFHEAIITKYFGVDGTIAGIDLSYLLDESLNKARIKLQILSDEKYLKHKINNLPKVEINPGNNSTLLRLCMRNKFPSEIETVMTTTKSNNLREFLRSCSSAPKFFYKTKEQ